MVQFTQLALNQVLSTTYTDKEIRRADHHDKVVSNMLHNKQITKRQITKKQSALVPVYEAQTANELQENFSPQIGVSEAIGTIDFVSYITDKFGIKCSDDIIREIERMVALYTAVVNSANMAGALSAIMLYVSSKYDHSISVEILKYIKEIFDLSPQSGCDVADIEEPGWLDFLKKFRTNWTESRSSLLFANFSKVLSLLVISGLYSITDLSFKVCDFKTFEPDLKVICGSAGDILTAVCDVVVFFAERIYYSVKTRSFSPLFCASLESADLDKDFAEIEAHFDLAVNGNLMKSQGIELTAYLSNLDSMSDRIKELMATTKGLDKRALETKYRKCLTMRYRINTEVSGGSFRRRPYTIKLYGKSSVGKSTCSTQLSRALLTSQGLSVSDEHKYNHIPGKRHWDGCKSDVVEINIDDHGNTKPDFVERSPCEDLMRINNNVTYSPPMADLENKGKVHIAPELLSITTNLEDLGSRYYSENPTSIQRRCDLNLEIDLKPEFVKWIDGIPAGVDTAKAIEANTVDGEYTPPVFDDIWAINVKEVIHSKDERSAAKYKLAEHNGKVLKGIGMGELIAYATEKFHIHRKQQFTMARSYTEKPKLDMCPKEGCYHLKACCPHHGNEPQFGMEDVTNMITQSTESILAEGNQFYETWDWLAYIPDSLARNKWFIGAMCFSNRHNLTDEYKRCTIIHLSLVALFMVASCCVLDGYVLLASLFAMTCCAFSTQLTLINAVKDSYVEQLEERRTLNLVHQRSRDNISKYIVMSSAALGTIYLISKAYKNMVGNKAQGSLSPTTKADIDARDAEGNVWAEVVRRPLPATQRSIEHTLDNVTNKVQKNLLYATLRGADLAPRKGNVFFVDSNMVMVPQHYFDESGGDSIMLECQKEKANQAGGTFKTRVDIGSSVKLGDSDMRLCYTASGGSYANLTQYFPTGDIVDHPFRMLYRVTGGELTINKGYAVAKVTTNSVATFKGGEYSQLSCNTFPGLCGAVLISEKKETCITGLHLGGRKGTPRGCFGSYTLDQIVGAIEEVKTLPGVLKTGSEGVFKPQLFGKDVIVDEPLHPKSPVNYMPEGTQMQYHGSCMGKASSRSVVRQTPISDEVEKITGQGNIWGKPTMMPPYKPWQTAIAGMSHPAEPVEHSIAAVSIQNYVKPLLEIAKSEQWRHERPLTDHETLCGKDGVKFIDSINLSTSMGPPLTGPKRKYIIEHEPTDDKPNNIELDPEVMAQIREADKIYRSGERCHLVVKACQKDEVLPLSKDKCRIMFAGSIITTYEIRKYFLPVIRMIQMNPLVSECAVGINCHGPEWEQFHQFVYQHGEDKLFGGDYGKYDQKLPAQKILAAIRILIDIAREMDYSEGDILAMESMAGDLAYALVAWNGDLMSLQSGGHVSGNSLTVIINGICGSLNLRDFFYTKYDESVDFRKAVSLMTYGDDNIGSVAAGYEDFNIAGASEFLAKYGQVYTMPDKESELQPYLNPDDFEFLKRKSVFHPKLGVNIGALLEKSIMKSLHCYLRPKNSPLTCEEACALNIDTALREWFNHGEEMYEFRRKQMKAVAENSGIEHMCTMLNVSYDNMVDEWKYKYAGGPRPELEIDSDVALSCFEQESA